MSQSFPPQQPHPQQPQPPQPPPAKTKRRFGWLPLIGALAAGLVVGSCSASLASLGDDSVAAAPAATVTATATATATVTAPAPEPAPSEEPPAEAAPEDNCVELTDKQLEAVDEGIRDPTKVRTSRGETVLLPDDLQQGQFRKVAAVKIFDGADEEVDVLFAMGEDTGPIIGVGAVARLYFTWGEAAEEGSPVSDYATDLSVSDEAIEATDCLNR